MFYEYTTYPIQFIGPLGMLAPAYTFQSSHAYHVLLFFFFHQQNFIILRIE